MDNREHLFEDGVREQELMSYTSRQPTIEEVIEPLSKMQIASIKRVWASQKSYFKKMDTLSQKIKSLQMELEEINTEALGWQYPVEHLLKGYTPMQIVNYLDSNKTTKKEEGEEGTLLED